VPSIDVREVALAFGAGPARTVALDRIDLNIRSGLLTVVAGPSGSGKTSLLSVLGAMLKPDSGAVNIDGTDIAALDHHQRSKFRRDKTGYVFQLFRLMPALTAEENVRLSLELRHKDNALKRAREALEEVGLANKMYLRPNQMSGGEQQRVAIARAFAHDPVVLLADEPTASLDTANGLHVTKLLARLAEDQSRIVIVVTHDPRVVPFAQRIVSLQDGRIAKDELCSASPHS